MRRDGGGHANRDAGRAVDQQVGEQAGEDLGLFLLAVVGRDEIDRAFVQARHQLDRGLGEAGFGVAIGSSVIAVDIAEIALPIHELQAFARAEGYYSGCPRQIRIEQLKHLAHLTAQLYPVMRVSLFDARKIYSAPITIFGPLRAVIYLGQKYLVFRVPDRIQALSQHFDGLIREAEIGTRDLPAVINGLLQELGAVAD